MHHAHQSLCCKIFNPLAILVPSLRVDDLRDSRARSRHTWREAPPLSRKISAQKQTTA